MTISNFSVLGVYYMTPAVHLILVLPVMNCAKIQNKPFLTNNNNNNNNNDDNNNYNNNNTFY